MLRGEGFRVRRLDCGMPDWAEQGLGVASASVPPPSP